MDNGGITPVARVVNGTCVSQLELEYPPLSLSRRLNPVLGVLLETKRNEMK